MNIYKDFFGLNFSKIYWSRLAQIHIASDGFYRCNCCGRYPHECLNKSSAKEYEKIKKIVEVESGFGVSTYLCPIKTTGYLRADQFCDAYLIWKIQRELANKAGFVLRRSSFW